MKQSLDELRIYEDQLILGNITHCNFLDVGDRLTATEAMMPSKSIVQEILESDAANKNEENDFVQNKSFSQKLQN